MPRANVVEHLRRIDALGLEIERFAPEDIRGIADFRADLGGLLVVAIAATYETCVKETLLAYSSGFNPQFSSYVERRYEKLNSKVSVSDLNYLCKMFDPLIHRKFCDELSNKKSKIISRVGINIEERFQQILNWRHGFAHGWNRNVTVDEALEFNRSGKIVIYTFERAFNG